MYSVLFFVKSLFKELKVGISIRLTLAKFKSENRTCIFYPGTRIHNVKFELNVVLYSNVRIEDSIVGSYSYIQKNSTVFHTEIGRFCSIASGVSIGPGIHHTNTVSLHPIFFNKDTPLPVVFAKENLQESFKKTVIGNDVWIGERAIILDGVKIGNGAVIAAGSVVNSDVPDFAVVAGVPASLKKMRFDEKTRTKLLKSEWWLKSDCWLQENYKSFNSISDFINIENSK